MGFDWSALPDALPSMKGNAEKTARPIYGLDTRPRTVYTSSLHGTS